MNARERVWSALNHKEPDRVPFDLGGTPVTGIHIKAYTALRAALGLAAIEPELSSVNMQLARVDADVSERLLADVGNVSPKPATNFKLEFSYQGDYIYVRDEFKIGRRMPKANGWYYDLYHYPLGGEITEEDVDRFPWPDPQDPARFIGMAERAAMIANEGQAVAVGDLCAGFVEMYSYMRGFEDYFVDLAANHQLAGKIMDQLMEIKMAFWERAFPLLGDNIDVIITADDLAGQNGLLVSPRTYRQLIKPRHKKFFDFLHSHSRAKIFYHCCGAIRTLIPDLIESGVDILNPVQVSAVGMDTAELKREFGKDLVFWGGGVDTQRILGSGSVQQVRDEVKRRLDDLMPGAGFVFATVHNIQGNVPPENIIAMWEAWREYGVYGRAGA